MGKTKRVIIERLLVKKQTVEEIMGATGYSRSWIKEVRTRYERNQTIRGLKGNGV